MMSPDNKIYFAGFILILLFLIFYLKPKTAEIKISGKVLITEVADNPLTRSKGLMFRNSASPILFVFSKPTTESFWMKNVNFPLDIIWIDADKKIIGTDRMETCGGVNRSREAATMPFGECKTYSPPAEIKYALEVEAGFVEKNKIKVGGTLEINL